MQVRFLIDGKLRWLDFDAPYGYGGDGGYLVTPWIAKTSGTSPEPHEFVAEVAAADGTTARVAVTARVRNLELAQVPAGIWGRVPEPHFEKPFAEWLDYLNAEMNITGDNELWIGRSFERAHAYEVTGNARTLRILAPILRAPPGRVSVISGWRLHGGLCKTTEAFATYSITEVEAGDPPELGFRLDARRDPCARRRALLEGLWRRLD
jgi:hypothetical protein